jgi:hypothetical protein
MKWTDEVLIEAQKQAQIYRQKLQAGKVRVLPEKEPGPPPKQKDEVESQQAQR